MLEQLLEVHAARSVRRRTQLALEQLHQLQVQPVPPIPLGDGRQQHDFLRRGAQAGEASQSGGSTRVVAIAGLPVTRRGATIGGSRRSSSVVVLLLGHELLGHLVHHRRQRVRRDPLRRPRLAPHLRILVHARLACTGLLLPLPWRPVPVVATSQVRPRPMGGDGLQRLVRHHIRRQRRQLGAMVAPESTASGAGRRAVTRAIVRPTSLAVRCQRRAARRRRRGGTSRAGSGGGRRLQVRR